MNNTDYHQNNTHRSSTQFNKVIYNRADHFYPQALPDFVGLCADEGTLFHTLLGEPEMFEKEFDVTNTSKYKFNNRTSSIGVNSDFMFEKEGSVAAGKTLVMQKDVKNMQRKVDNVLANEEINKLLSNAIPERSFFGELEGLPVKVRPDLICFETDEDDNVTKIRIIDIKTSSKKATIENAELSCFTYSYWLALYMYKALVEKNLREFDVHIPVTFDYLFVCRKKDNDSYGIFKSTPYMHVKGHKDFQRAVESITQIDSGNYNLLQTEIISEF